jgi:hypothetical protein
VKHGVYCTKHDGPHTGFTDGRTTACLRCVEEEVQARKDLAEEYCARLEGGLADEAWKELQEAAELSSEITGDEDPVSILRFLVTCSHRLVLPLEDLLVQILDRRSASILLPSSPF